MIRYLIILLVFSVSITNELNAASILLTAQTQEPMPATNSSRSFARKFFIINLTPRQIFRLTGIRLTLKEKIALKLFQRSKKESRHRRPGGKSADLAQTAYVFGLIGLIGIPILGILSIPFAIIAVSKGDKALKIDPTNKKAKSATVMGIITIAFFIFLIALILLLLGINGWTL